MILQRPLAKRETKLAYFSRKSAHKSEKRECIHATKVAHDNQPFIYISGKLLGKFVDIFTDVLGDLSLLSFVAGAKNLNRLWSDLRLVEILSIFLVGRRFYSGVSRSPYAIRLFPCFWRRACLRKRDNRLDEFYDENLCGNCDIDICKPASHRSQCRWCGDSATVRTSAPSPPQICSDRIGDERSGQYAQSTEEASRRLQHANNGEYDYSLLISIKRYFKTTIREVLSTKVGRIFTNNSAKYFL